MTIVDVDIVGAENHTKFLDETISGSFDAQDLQDLNRMVTRRPSRIYALNRQHIGQIDTICLNQPAITDGLYSASIVIEDGPDTLRSTRRVEDFGDLLETSERDIVEDDLGQLTQPDDNLLSILITHIERPDTNDVATDGCLICIHDLEISAVGIITLLVQAIDDIALEFEVVVEDGVLRVAVHLETKEPLADVVLVAFLKVLSLPVKLDKLLIFHDDCLKRVRIVEDAPFAH